METDPTCIGYVHSSGWPCQQPATRLVVAGCVHEHVDERPLCDWHADDVSDGRMVCGNCSEAGHPGVYLQAVPAVGVRRGD